MRYIKAEVSDVTNIIKDLKGQLESSHTHRDNGVLEAQVERLLKADAEKELTLQQLRSKLSDVKRELEETRMTQSGGLGMGAFGLLGILEKDNVGISKKGGPSHVIYFLLCPMYLARTLPSNMLCFVLSTLYSHNHDVLFEVLHSALIYILCVLCDTMLLCVTMA